ncbi:hypothetical protein [Caldimonas tepidiphila]|uniref:hypothetical protein n=1 Tax=Caldimonas tepidiphila TaxID=2315841 RepID=UPI000E5AA369|nr:hypothetical protein [Caldimonas tepidiphila]
MTPDSSIIQTEIQLINATAGLAKAIEVLTKDLPEERRAEVFLPLGGALGAIQQALALVQERIKHFEDEQESSKGGPTG